MYYYPYLQVKTKQNKTKQNKTKQNKKLSTEKLSSLAGKCRIWNLNRCSEPYASF